MKKLLGILLYCVVPWSGVLAEGTLLIENGELHGFSEHGALRGDMLILDGRIAKVGGRIEAPAEALRIDAGGRPVTAGLFNAYSQLGLVEIDAVAGTRDYVVDLPLVGPSVRLEGAINSHGEVWRQALTSGVTSALSAATFAQTPFAGNSMVLRLGMRDNPVLRPDVSLSIAMGQRGAQVSGSSRAGNLGLLRQAFFDAAEYARTRDWHEGYALGPHDLRALEAAKKSRRTLSVFANRVSDIRAAIEFADSFSMPLVILGGAEAWRLAEVLKLAGAAVVVSPLQNLPTSFESLASRIDNAVVLHKAGVKIAFMASDPHESSKLRHAAGNMVAEGLPWHAALAAITSNPAQIWGVDDQVGSLQVGRLGDVVIWSGDPLEVTTWPEQVFVAGNAINMRSRQDALFERYQSQ